MGRQGAISVATVVFLWLIAVPLAYVFAFRLGLGVSGIFLGITAGVALNTACMVLLITLPNWDTLSAQITAKIQAASTFHSRRESQDD